ncbi:MAG: Na/Pi cotransporter family protein, partial [Clostridia bacterium]|nr:Na/Pi cotransporter family protein [Clostridia bacterium]
SVGILQALAATGQITYGAVIPIVMGDGIGSCVPTLISSVGANKEAKRAAAAHLFFNVIGTGVWLTVFCVVREVFALPELEVAASMVGVAIANTAFKLLSTAVLLPISGWIEKLVRTVVPDGKEQDEFTELDERLLSTPPLAIERCHDMTVSMAKYAVQSMKDSLSCFTSYSGELAEKIRKYEDKTDRMEDRLGEYLVKLSTRHVSTSDSEEITELLKVIGDYERIADHSVNLLESVEELRGKNLQFSEDALAELSIMARAIEEVLDLSLQAFISGELSAALEVEPLEQVIDAMKEELRTRHILRMKEGRCHIEAGFVLSDVLTNLERVSDHCSNIAGCVVDTAQHNFNLHENMRDLRVNNEKFNERYEQYSKKYRMPARA